MKADTSRTRIFRRFVHAILFVDWKPNRLELYNLTDDIGEQNNLAEKMPEKAAELYQLLASYLENVNAEKPRSLRAEAKP